MLCLLPLWFCALPTAPATGGEGKVFLSRREALDLAFPHAHLEERILRPDRRQLARASELAGEDLRPGKRRVWIATRKGKTLGSAWFDSHRVRSQRESLMVVVGNDGRLRRVEVVAFGEPLEYLPKGAFYRQFEGKALDRELQLQRGLRGVTGATLSSRATTAAVRRVLALRAVLLAPAPPPSPEPEPAPEPAPAASQAHLP